MAVLPIIISLLISLAIIRYSPFFRHLPYLSFRLMSVFFAVKCATGFLFLYIYSHYYDSESADIYKYFNDGMIMAGAFRDNPADYLRMLTGINAGAEHLNEYYSQMVSWFRPWEEPVYNDNRIVIRFNALLGIFSGGNIVVHTIFANLLSFAGLVAIYKFVCGKISRNKLKYIMPGLILFPSVLFWGSGILKESILFFAIGLFLLYSTKLIKEKTYHPVFLLNIAVSIALLLTLKSYVLLILIPLFITFYIIKNKQTFTVIIIYPSVFTLWAVIFIIAGFIFPEYDPLLIIATKQNSFVSFSEYVEAGSIISNRLMNPDIISFISFIPSGFINTLIRPHFFDGGSILIMMAALENFLIWIMVILMIFFGKRKSRYDSFFWFCISFVVITFTFVGMVTPIYGGLVRYKIPALPFLWIAFIAIIDFAKIKKYYWLMPFFRIKEYQHNQTEVKQ